MSAIDIEVIVSFDTTGSMYPCITQVRREVTAFTKELFSSIKGFRMGIIAHGDYCDKGRTYVTKEHELSTNESSLVSFINGCGNTDGGDSPECYELVLHNARSFKWTAGKSKVLVIIGDDIPHSPAESQNTLKLDWRNELKCLLEMGVKVYAVQALNRHHATHFYNEIAKTTGGFKLDLDQFADVTNLIKAICYQQAGESYLDSFEQKISDSKRMSRSMKHNFGTLRGRTPEDVARDIERAYGKIDLEAVPSGRFQVMRVDKDVRIDDFVRDNGLTFKKGRGFYEFTKSVYVQSYKEIILRDKLTGDMFTGEKARKILGIPIGENSQVKPSKFESKYDAFIQSTSLNRKLIGGTHFLYEVDESR